jgi:hypothetical protein
VLDESVHGHLQLNRNPNHMLPLHLPPPNAELVPETGLAIDADWIAAVDCRCDHHQHHQHHSVSAHALEPAVAQAPPPPPNPATPKGPGFLSRVFHRSTPASAEGTPSTGTRKTSAVPPVADRRSARAWAELDWFTANQPLPRDEDAA